MLDITKIEIHRAEKIKSIFTNRIDFELTKLNNLLDGSQYADEECSQLNFTLNTALNLDYGGGELSQDYVAHPLRVAFFVQRWLKYNNQRNIDILCVALLHNVLEKKALSVLQVNKRFGRCIAKLIEVLTVDRKKENIPEWRKAYYSRIHNEGTLCQIVKLFDKFDNIYSLCLNPDRRIRDKYLQEIEMYVKPIVTQHAPLLENYFDQLIESTRQIGFISKEDFLKGHDLL